LDTISLVDICDKREGIFGAPGKARRPVQKRFQKHKELSRRGYKKLLEKYNITPGPATYWKLKVKLLSQNRKNKRMQRISRHRPTRRGIGNQRN
jgi:hypothetical protein